MMSSIGEAVLYSEAWITTEEGMITRQDLDLSEGKILRGRVTNLFDGESGEVIVLEGAEFNTRTLDATVVDSLKADYAWRQSTLETDGSFRVTRLDLESYESFTMVVTTSDDRFGASRIPMSGVGGFVDGELIKANYFGSVVILDLR